jgi:uncharacterized protein YgiM (DUF1202 family)
MKITQLSIQKPLIIITTTVMIATSTFAPSSAVARPPGGPISHLPLGHDIVHVGSLVFFFLDGIFYRRAPQGYIVAPAPIGAIVHELPRQAVLIPADGVQYYTLDGTYYQRVPEGYAVVQKPVKQYTQNPVAHKGDRVCVVVEILNVRSGPGLDHPAVKSVREGQVLEVHASQGDWVFVKLPDASFGWINLKYTTPANAAAMG